MLKWLRYTGVMFSVILLASMLGWATLAQDDLPDLTESREMFPTPYTLNMPGFPWNWRSLGEGSMHIASSNKAMDNTYLNKTMEAGEHTIQIFFILPKIGVSQLGVTGDDLDEVVEGLFDAIGDLLELSSDVEDVTVADYEGVKAEVSAFAGAEVFMYVLLLELAADEYVLVVHSHGEGEAEEALAITEHLIVNMDVNRANVPAISLPRTTFTNEELGYSIDYPEDWGNFEFFGQVVFASDLSTEDDLMELLGAQREVAMGEVVIFVQEAPPSFFSITSLPGADADLMGYLSDFIARDDLPDELRFGQSVSDNTSIERPHATVRMVQEEALNLVIGITRLANGEYLLIAVLTNPDDFDNQFPLMYALIESIEDIE